MNPEQLARADLALLTTGAPGLVAAALSAYFDGALVDQGEDKKPRAAMRTAIAEFRKTHERIDGVWAKRAAAVEPPARGGVYRWNYNVLAGDVDGDGDVDFACQGCMGVQPEMACRVCGVAGPGNCCMFCGNYLCGTCPGCTATWQPLQASEAGESAGVRVMRAMVQEVRTAGKNIGVVRMIVNTSVPDDWYTVIPPTRVAELIKTGAGPGTGCAIVDIDHQICDHGRTARTGCVEHDGPLTGAWPSSVTAAKIPWKDDKGKVEMIDGAIVETSFDLSDQRTAAAYEGCRTGKYTQGSVLFKYPADLQSKVDQAARTGRVYQFQDSDILAIPAYTLTGKASNPAAWITEVRTSRLFGTKIQDAQQVIAKRDSKDDEAKPAPAGDATAAQPPAETKPATAADENPLAGLAQAVASIGGDGVAVPSPEKPVEPPAPDASASGGAPELSLSVVNAKVTALSETVEQVRTMAPTWKPSFDAHQTAHVELVKTVEGQRTQIEKLQALNKELVKICTDGYVKLAARIASLTVPAKRDGDSGARSPEIAEAMRAAVAQTKTDHERAHDKQLDEFERVGRLS